MQQLSTLAQWRSAANDARRRGRSVGLVATMGALHAGHESLIAAARENCDEVIVTIFVNPLQFSSPDDFANYPETVEADLAACERWGASTVIVPSVAEMWPHYGERETTTVVVPELSEQWEGAQRPGHFSGVAAVVTKIFSLTGECTAFFGEKDFQQLAIVRRLVSDLALAVTVAGCPTVRDADGLALSSRNVRLSESGRARALGLSRALKELSSAPPLSADEARSAMKRVLNEHGVETAYAQVVDSDTLRVLTPKDQGNARAIIAGIVDGVRLLDNGPVTVVSAPEESHAAGH